MPNYPVHTIASAPESSKPRLEQLKQAFGVIPNIAALDVTLAYLKGKDAESEEAQEHANSSSLAL